MSTNHDVIFDMSEASDIEVYKGSTDESEMDYFATLDSIAVDGSPIESNYSTESQSERKLEEVKGILDLLNSAPEPKVLIHDENLSDVLDSLVRLLGSDNEKETRKTTSDTYYFLNIGSIGTENLVNSIEVSNVHPLNNPSQSSPFAVEALLSVDYQKLTVENLSELSAFIESVNKVQLRYRGSVRYMRYSPQHSIPILMDSIFTDMLRGKLCLPDELTTVLGTVPYELISPLVCLSNKDDFRAKHSLKVTATVVKVIRYMCQYPERFGTYKDGNQLPINETELTELMEQNDDLPPISIIASMCYDESVISRRLLSGAPHGITYDFQEIDLPWK